MANCYPNLLGEKVIEKEIINFINKKHFKGDRTQLESFLLTKIRMPREEIRNILRQMINKGQLSVAKNGIISVKGKGNLLKGKLIGTDKGYAFCSVPGKEEDYFIPAHKINNALNGDTVLIKPTKLTDKSTEAEVVEIVEHANTTVVGTLFFGDKGAILETDDRKFNQDIFVKNADCLNAEDGDKVVVKLEFNKGNKISKAKVIEILGKSDELTTLELAIIRQHKLYEKFPSTVILESEEVNKPISSAIIKNRVDLRNEIIFTIDGEDARDLDDAISLTYENGIYHLGVHIADVTHYVKENSELDREAYLRGTSVYFPNMVLPMLPKSLSNGICSLNEGEDRLTLSVFMDINDKGEVVNHKICESVINSKARLTYTDVYNSLIGEKTEHKMCQELAQTFALMNKLAKLLEQNRDSNGALDLDVPESYFELNEKLEVISIKERERNDAHKLIESFMVVCNETVAKHFCLDETPFVYRVHEKPVAEKTKDVKAFMEGLGYNIPEVPKTIYPEYYQRLINVVKDDENVVSTVHKVILRSLQKAKYSEKCLGHFGLALEYYCHFTSPIRRYPDLAIHRIIKERLHSELDNNRKIELEDFVIESSERSSMMEKNADEAERDVDDLLKAIYMRDKVGMEFEGIISGVTNFGIFVQLDGGIEGLVKIEDLPKDAYLFFEKSYILKGQHHKYALGENVKIQVLASNIFTRKIDFKLV